MVPVAHDSVAEARKGFKSMLDAADSGAPATLRREGKRFALVDAARLRYSLASLQPRAEVTSEDGAWVIALRGLPIAVEAEHFDDAVNEAVEALREYAYDWVDHLSSAPNHAPNWGLVHLVDLSSDDELREWLMGLEPPPR